MTQTRSVLVSERDHARLHKLIDNAAPNITELLFEELDAATVVAEADLPRDVVTMGSTATFVDMDSGESSTVKLVYPSEANVSAGCVSVLAPVGAALIGLRVGEAIEWPMPRGGNRRLRVTAVDHDEGSRNEE